MKFILKQALKSIRYRRSTLILSIISISLSTILLLGVERLRTSVHESFSNTIAGTDLIVGARTGSVSLLLSTVFHMGFPNQNVDWATYEYVSNLDQVSWSIPLSLGDSYRGVPVVATENSFFEYFMFGKNQKLVSAEGNVDIENKQCVLGFTAAKELGYNIGDKLIITHGMGDEDFVKHDDAPFIIGGVLKPTGTPVDRSIFVSLEELNAIHSNFYLNSEEDYDVFSNILDNYEHEHEPAAISGFLLGLKNKTEILNVQRLLNNYKAEPLTAILPAGTLIDLWSIVRPIEKTLLVISVLVLVVSLGGILASILIGLNNRRREMAILRSVGAKPKHIFGLILFETIGVIVAGVLTGTIVLQAILLIAKPVIIEKLGVFIAIGRFTTNEFVMLFAIIILSVIISLIPAYNTYKRSLIDGLIINN